MKLGCICYLVSSASVDVTDLKMSLALLEVNYLREHPCDVYLYHESDLCKRVRKTIQDSVNFPLIFKEIKFPQISSSIKINFPDFKIGYRHMCHFFANDIFNRPELEDYEYYMRLDTDSEILSYVPFNIFQRMKDDDSVYGFISNTGLDRAAFSEGLWPLADDFVRSHDFTTYRNLYTDIPERRYFYTNFEVCKLSWFRATPWTNFFDAVDRAQGIYSTRWGDHIIRFIGVNLYAPPEKIVRIPIHYYHQSEFGREYSAKNSAPTQQRTEEKTMKQLLRKCIMRTPLYSPLKKWGIPLMIKMRIELRRRILVWLPFYFTLRRWSLIKKQKQQLVAWVKAGQPSPPPHIVKERAVRSYAEKFGLKILVETGTYYGDMVEAMKRSFSHVYSIELSQHLYRTTKRRFAGDKTITIINGDSGIELGKLVAKISDPALFWLDGHYSEGETAQGSKDTPVFEELSHIFNSNRSGDVVLIDDARCFGTYPSYPSMEELVRFIKSKRPDARIEVEADSIRITPLESCSAGERTSK